MAGGGSLTPDRLAFASPMAIACLVERAPCVPRRTCSISSRTNSPDCVVGAFPSFFARRARLTVCFSGMVHLLSTHSPNYGNVFSNLPCPSFPKRGSPPFAKGRPGGIFVAEFMNRSTKSDRDARPPIVEPHVIEVIESKLSDSALSKIFREFGVTGAQLILSQEGRRERRVRAWPAGAGDLR